MRVSRRSVLAAIPLMGCAGEARALVNIVHVTPDGEGDGSSWANAASFAAIGDLLEQLEPGGQVLLAADRGVYEIGEPVEIARGGRESREIHIRGVRSSTGEPMMAIIRGDRAGEEGPEGFKLMRGASHLKFSHFDFRDIGNGAFRAAGAISNLTIEDCGFENIYRFFENTAGNDEGHASIDGFVLRRCRGARVERGFLRIRYNSRNGMIEDCAAEGLAIDGGRIPVGCALDDRAGRITYRRVVMEGFQQRNGEDYWNGDGFSDEPGNFNIRYEVCEARGSTDGGFDCKSRDVVLIDCVAEDNKRNFRIWSDRATLTNCISRAPNFRGEGFNENASSSHLWIGGEENIEIDIANLTIEDGDATPIIEFNHDVGRVKIRGVTISSPRVNWGNDENRIRANMLIGEPRFHQNIANETP
ncbi:hypothetical protein [Candidatus Viadribacter manganicus]|nr:hypothetical protein [Candidatus Viadribacter manganicus]